MTVFTPEWRFTVAGTEYTDIAISDITHAAGRSDIYNKANQIVRAHD